jgi:hypothetical protein
MRKFRSFEQFWPYYLHEHSHPRTRALHFAGTTFAVLMTLTWMATGYETFLVLAVLGGYGFAWFSHFVVEFNRPATFGNPLWSLRADLRMYRKWLTGSLDDEFRRAGIRDRRAYSRKSRMGPRSLAAIGRT